MFSSAYLQLLYVWVAVYSNRGCIAISLSPVLAYIGYYCCTAFQRNCCPLGWAGLNPTTNLGALGWRPRGSFCCLCLWQCLLVGLGAVLLPAGAGRWQRLVQSTLCLVFVQPAVLPEVSVPRSAACWSQHCCWVCGACSSVLYFTELSQEPWWQVMLRNLLALRNPACFLVYSYFVLTLLIGKRCTEIYSGCSRWT